MKTIICALLMIAMSCNRAKPVEAPSTFKEAQQFFIGYKQTKDKALLKKSYAAINNNKDFKKTGITNANRDIVLQVYIYLKKYDELEKLLSADTLSHPDSKITLNTIKSLKAYKTDKLLARSYIDTNILQIKEQISKKPQDSLLYLSYFIMRIYLTDKETVGKEIDSMQNVNKAYSPFFYDAVLRNIVRKYPDAYLYNQ